MIATKQIIPGNPQFVMDKPHTQDFLEVAEFFCDTIQGENFVGYPATFLRLQHCTQSCVWCDTKEVWRYGNPYTFQALFERMEQAEFDVPRKLAFGQHLVVTGGSPLRQQKRLLEFFIAFHIRYGFVPFVEIENECTLMPMDELDMYIGCWNNSPKLKSSKNPDAVRYRPEILKRLSEKHNSWFKFVVSCEEDWQEIEQYYLGPGLIRKKQVVLMPLGATKAELEVTREIALRLAIQHNVRYSTREHIIIWDKKTGV